MDEITLTTLAASAADMARSIDTIWVLVTAALVFFMQAGFALVEAGFTRSKNSVNILYKNLMDFSVGSVIFWALGFGLMFGTDIAGVIGTPDLFFKNGWEGGIPAEAFLIFQTVFAATAATIVSGAMAERTEFKAYLIFSLVVSAVIYPVSGHWIWGGGWLSQLATPFHDFAGSTVVHLVGGVIALTGAMALGPRIGKYNGKGKVNAIPGHSITLGALGVFILWLGWFGFNPGSQLAASGAANANAIAHLFVTTNLAAVGGALAAMIISWMRWGKPSMSFALNGALGGLVGVTAGCAVVTTTGALLIGLISGVVLVFAVTFIDQVLHVDDPVGAISVHGVCGALGTIMVGLFSESTGLFYGHGAAQLVSQLIGVAAVAAWAGIAGFILFKILKATVGLRVPKRIEEEGLDIYEHGESAYN